MLHSCSLLLLRFQSLFSRCWLLLFFIILASFLVVFRSISRVERISQIWCTSLHRPPFIFLLRLWLLWCWLCSYHQLDVFNFFLLTIIKHRLAHDRIIRSCQMFTLLVRLSLIVVFLGSGSHRCRWLLVHLLFKRIVAEVDSFTTLNTIIVLFHLLPHLHAHLLVGRAFHLGRDAFFRLMIRSRTALTLPESLS